MAYSLSSKIIARKWCLEPVALKYSIRIEVLQDVRMPWPLSSHQKAARRMVTLREGLLLLW
jgi:hypothetical protein